MHSFQNVLFQTNKNAVEIFQTLCHLNSIDFYKHYLRKIYRNITSKVGFGHTAVNLVKAIFSPIWLGVWIEINAEYISFQQAMAQDYLRTHFTYAYTIRKPTSFSSGLLNLARKLKFSINILFRF